MTILSAVVLCTVIYWIWCKTLHLDQQIKCSDIIQKNMQDDIKSLLFYLETCQTAILQLQEMQKSDSERFDFLRQEIRNARQSDDIEPFELGDFWTRSLPNKKQ